MRPLREYINLLTRPGLRKSLVEVFFLFFLVIFLAAAFFFMTGAELALEKFRHGRIIDTIPVSTEHISSALDEALEEVKDSPSFEVVVGGDVILDELRNKFQEKVTSDQFRNNLKERIFSQLAKEADERYFIVPLDNEMIEDIESPSAKPGRVLSVIKDKPVALLIPLLMLVLALLMAPRILKPIKTLTSASEKLAKGDFETPIKVKEEDEIGILANMFERMRRNLKHKIVELQNTAHELALELNEKNITLEQARALQSSFIPEYIDKGSLKIATGHMLCEEVGGDFFDLLDLGSGKIAFIFGDVEGHGIRASFNMMSILTIFRVVANEVSDPIVITSEINDMIWRERKEPGRQFSASAIVGLIDQNSGIMRFVNSGHPNPLLWRDSEKHVEELSEGNPLLGFNKDYEFIPVQVNINHYDRLMLYTDGLIWSTDKDGEYLGDENLKTILASDHDLSVDQLVTRVSDKIRRFKRAKQKNDDDILFAIFGFEPEVWSYHQIPPATKENVIHEIIEYLESMDIPNDIISDFRLSMDELITNAMVHGNLDDLNKKIFVKYTVHHGEIRMVVQDEGEGFARDASTFLLDSDKIYEPGKRGVYLVKSIMDEVYYNDKGNEVTIVKKIIDDW